MQLYKFSWSYFLLILLLCPAFSAQGQVLATISYKGSKGPVNVPITVKEFTNTYRNVRQIAPTNAPSAKIFWEDYLRYRLGVEEGYNTPQLIKNPAIKNMFADANLKESFEQNLYKLLADKKLKGRIAVLDKQSKQLSKNAMLRMYKSNPEYSFNFILVSLPISPTAAQTKEARGRANKIYREVRKSKKPFNALIDIYSDDRISGKLSMARTRNTIFPSVYKKIKRMKNGQVSSPVEAPGGFYIIKLNRKISFSKANRTQIKVAHFDRERGKVLKNYFNGLKKKYKVQVNRSLLAKIR